MSTLPRRDSVRRGQVRWHRALLLLALLGGGAAPLLRVYPPDRVGWRWSSAALLPPLCLSRACFGVSCPGCGLTRSVVHLAHGDWAASWRAHHLGIPLALLVVLQVPYRLLALRQPRRRLLPERVGRWTPLALAVLLYLNWLLGLLAWF